MEQANAIDPGSAPPFRAPEVSPGMRDIISELDAAALNAGDAGYPSDEVARAARRICVAARTEGLYIEQALVRVKDAWRSTPGRLKPRPGGSDAALDVLVSACIREFYTER